MRNASYVVFSDPQYPGYVPLEQLAPCLPDTFAAATAETLATALTTGTTLVSFHGPYFPKAAWQTVLTFLERGGNVAIFGGMPFSRPVTADGTVEPEQDSYTRALHLGLFTAVAVPSGPVSFVSVAPCLRETPLYVAADAPGLFWACSPMLTQSSDFPDELGSSGPIDAVLTPLVHARGQMALPGAAGFATPAFLVDQRQGRFGGGRWLLSLWLPATSATWLTNATAIARMIALAGQGAQTVEVAPALACGQPGSAMEVVVTAQVGQGYRGILKVSVPEGDSSVGYQREVWLAAAPQEQQMRLHLPAFAAPGLYRITLEGTFDDGIAGATESGFWLWDQALVTATHGQALVAGTELLYQGDVPFFVYGTTYMDSAVQRHFLSRPNPARWDRDFAAMRAAGINLLRTGVWAGWRQFITETGAIDEGWLRALDAFVMTACKHGLQVIFTFFAFSPLAPDGAHPWFSAQALAQQEAFIATLARRYAAVELLSWDLINEPSMGDPKQIFAQRPVPMPGSEEAEVFRRWLAGEATLDELALRWRVTPDTLPTWEHVHLPDTRAYSTSPRDTEYRAMLQVSDYTRWTQEAFAQWAARMRGVIRAAGSHTLVGVGQDEAGARPAAQFHARSVDYTTTHPWWNLNALLWDLVLDKAPTTPNLAQETGIMLTRDVDMRQWRSDEASGRLLERKLMLLLATRSAGAIQWLWHINPYMTSENENSIGLVRVDGSAKPELLAMLEFGRLVRAIAPRLTQTPPAPVWVVVPYGQWFVRPELGVEATQSAVRTLGYDFGIVPQMVSEYGLSALLDAPVRPTLVIVPGVQMLDRQAWHHLRQYVREGGTLLVSGILTRDSHNFPIPAGWHFPLGRADETHPVSRYEEVAEIEGTEGIEGSQATALAGLRMTFDGEKTNYIRKAHNALSIAEDGAGRVIWCGLPVELSSTSEAIHALYAFALGEQGRATRGPTSPVLVVRRPLDGGMLTVLVSESSRVQRVTLGEGIEVWIEPERAGAVLQTHAGSTTFGGCALRTLAPLAERLPVG